jgi:hypothetical protein
MFLFRGVFQLQFLTYISPKVCHFLSLARLARLKRWWGPTHLFQFLLDRLLWRLSSVQTKHTLTFDLLGF